MGHLSWPVGLLPLLPPHSSPWVSAWHPDPPPAQHRSHACCRDVMFTCTLQLVTQRGSAWLLPSSRPHLCPSPCVTYEPGGLAPSSSGARCMPTLHGAFSVTTRPLGLGSQACASVPSPHVCRNTSVILGVQTPTARDRWSVLHRCMWNERVSE